MKTQRYSAVLSVLALLALLCGRSQAAEPLRVSMNLAPMVAQALVAKERGIFAKQGLDVTILSFTQSQAAVDALLTGAADITLTAEAPLVGVHFKGQPWALLASIEYSLLKTLATTPAVRGGADLKGRRIGYVANSGSEQCVNGWAKRAALSPGELTLVPMLAQELPVAAAEGRIDAYCVWEPYVARGRQALGDKAKLLAVDDPVTPTFYVAVAPDFAAKKPAVAQAFLKSLIEAEGWIAANREDTITLVAKAVGMNRPELAEIWNEYTFRVSIEPRSLEPLQRNAQWRIDNGKGHGGAKVVPDFARLFDSAPLKQVAPERVKM